VSDIICSVCENIYIYFNIYIFIFCIVQLLMLAVRTTADVVTVFFKTIIDPEAAFENNNAPGQGGGGRNFNARGNRNVARRTTMGRTGDGATFQGRGGG
jgi:hypothetical protein